MWYPQKQTELALQFAHSKIIWTPAELNLETIEEEKYKLFLEALESGDKISTEYEYIKGAKSNLSQEISDIAELIKTQHKQSGTNEKVSVLLDTHISDQEYALDLAKTLLENKIQPFINPQEDDPRKNINLLAQRISQVSKLVFFYGLVSREWVLERMSAALQIIVTNNYPIDDFFIYMAPPLKDANEIFLKQRFLKVSVINNSSNINTDKNVLHHFLKSLRGEVI